MKRVAVFGNAGGGKSTLARRLAEITRLPLHPIDQIQWTKGGGQVSHEEYLKVHDEIIGRDEWIIDGYGCTPSSWQRFAAADTLVYIDLPLRRHYLWVTKRFVKGLFGDPEGWPEDSPMWSSTLRGLRVVSLCERHLGPRYRELVAQSAAVKRVHHLKSPRDIRAFLDSVKEEYPA